MDAKTARTLNIRALVAVAGGPTSFATRYGAGRWSQPQVSLWISEANPKPIGHKLARSIEEAVGKPNGWLDTPPHVGKESHSGGLELAILAPALTWLDFDEDEGGRYEPVERARRLLELCALLDAAGGTLTPRQADELIATARARRRH